MKKTWDSNTRFDNAIDWIRASNKQSSVKLDDDIIELLAALCVKRQGVFRIRKTPPKPYGGALSMVWNALRFSRHAAQWGNFAPWRDGFTAELMSAGDVERELFNRAFDQFLLAAKLRQGGR